MKVTQEEPVQRQVALSIEVEPQELESYLQRGYQRLAQKISVPGFRKGKAPRGVLEHRVGQEAFLQEAMEFLVPDMTDRAIAELELEVSALPQVEVVGTDPVMLKATVPLTPAVELGNYHALHIEPPVVVVEETRVEETLEQLRREVTPWEPVERSIQMGDLVVMDLTGEVDGELVLNEPGTSYLVSEEPHPVPNFGTALLAMEQGERREFALPFPEEDAIDSRLAGKTCQFTVVAKEVKERRLPTADDEFAKGVGQGFDSLESLKEHIRARLRESQEHEARHAYETQLVEKILQDAQVELPPLLIEQEIDHLLEELERRARATGQRQADVDAYIANLQKTPEEFRTELQPRAVERLERAAVLMKVAHQEGVEASEEAVEEEVGRMVQEAGQQGEEMRRLFRHPNNRESLTQSLLTRLTIERLAEIARDPATPSKQGEASPDQTTEDSVQTQGEGPTP